MRIPWFTRQLQQLLRPKPTAIFAACAIGVLSALAAVGLRQSIIALQEWRVGLAGTFPAWIVLPVGGILGGYLSGLLVERLSPESSGSGIPQVKAALGYVPIALDLRVAIVKWLSTCLSLGSGMALGRQGPTVQIGAALAGQLSHWTDTSPAYQRQLIAAGAAAGLAASFNAPIAGVLFVVEELLQDVSDLTMGTAIFAAVIGGVISRSIGGREMIPDISHISTHFYFGELPLLIAVGVLAGGLGAFCNRSFLASLDVYQRQFSGSALSIKMAFAGGVTGVISLILPHSLLNIKNLQAFLIVGDVDWQISIAILLTQLVMCWVGFGSMAPGGLFAPSLIFGAALGNFVATGMQSCYQQGWLPVNLVLSSPTVYALTGMSAVFSAITHRPIIAIALVLEMSTQLGLALPLMIGSISAYLVAEKLFPGSIYFHLLARQGIALEKSNQAEQTWAGLTAADIMERRVATLPSQMPISEALAAFAYAGHRGFPIVAEGRLVGILTQSDLSTRAQRSTATNISELMTQRVITVSPQDSLTSVLHLLDRYQIGRLPVLDNQKLVGIITRADIIRAEVDRVSNKVSPLQVQQQPSYVVYQTKAPATGRGRLLVPLSNPQTADVLLCWAAAIARKHHYEIECLHVILIPTATAPAETKVKLEDSLRLLEWAVDRGQTWGIPIHTQARVAHHTAQAILETVRERHINLLCMGWQGSTSKSQRIFGNTVDTIIQQAVCDVVLIKLGVRLLNAWQGTTLTRNSYTNAIKQLAALDRWLVPSSGGPNAEYALQLLPMIVSLSDEPQIHLCQIFAPDHPAPDISSLQQAASLLYQNSGIAAIITPLFSENIAGAVIDFAEDKNCQGIILGASREGLLRQTLHGNIPESIARGSNSTVIVVRKSENALELF
jgi:chloride channel protein, CIC family